MVSSVNICVSTYALIDCCVASLVALSEAILSSSRTASPPTAVVTYNVLTFATVTLDSSTSSLKIVADDVIYAVAIFAVVKLITPVLTSSVVIVVVPVPTCNVVVYKVAILATVTLASPISTLVKLVPGAQRLFPLSHISTSLSEGVAV